MEYLDLGPFFHASGTVRLPGSKSISNRVLLLAALAEGETTIVNLLDSDDTRVMRNALATLGVTLREKDGDWVVQGVRGAFPAKEADLFLGNAGTAVRPLTAALAVNGGNYRIHGVPRMHERPIGDLVDGLRQIGAQIDYEDRNGYPPLRIRAAAGMTAGTVAGVAGTAAAGIAVGTAAGVAGTAAAGITAGTTVNAAAADAAPAVASGAAAGATVNAAAARAAPAAVPVHLATAPLVQDTRSAGARAPVRVRGDVSSQFLTALLMALPLVRPSSSSASGNTVIEVEGELISKPYIDITIRLMARFGVQVARDGWQRFTVPSGARYQSPGRIVVEGDASSASYFLAAGALGGGPVRVEGVGRASIQGDVAFADALGRMGAHVTLADDWIEARGAGQRGAGQLAALDMDCNLIPDAAMTLAVAALFARGPSTLRNIASWRVKETDRLTAMATELRKVGACVSEGDDFLVIAPPERFTPHALIDTYDDHRMAMCFSLASLAGVPVRINDPKCVGKTFPDYFARFLALAKT